MEVKTEYERMLSREPDRVWVLERLKPNQGFYSLCSSYDSLAVEFYKMIKDVDSGEAEAAAQQKKIGANYVLSDDLRFRIAITKVDPTIRVLTTLHVIALLDLNKFLLDTKPLLRTHLAQHPFSSKLLREAYEDSAKDLSIVLTKKDIEKKCGIKELR